MNEDLTSGWETPMNQILTSTPLAKLSRCSILKAAASARKNQLLTVLAMLEIEKKMASY